MKAIIIGATSGIGRELAKQLSERGYLLGITGRRKELLNSLSQELAGESFRSCMDLTNISESVVALERLLEQMGDVDLIVVNSGTGCTEPSFPLQGELDTIAVNVSGFTAIANTAFHYFAQRGFGHIAATSSIAGLRGGPYASYNASKAYISNYLEGLNCRAHRLGVEITVTDIRPGFVDTNMAKGNGIFWVASVEKAVKQIIKAIVKKRRIVYVTRRWKLIAVLLSIMPAKLYLKAIR